MHFTLVSDVNRRLESWLPTLYLAVVLLLGGSYAFVTPPFFAPDEAPQSMRGLQVANGTLLARVNPSGQGDFMDSGFSSTAAYFYAIVDKIIHQQSRDRTVPRIMAEQIHSQRSVEWSKESTFDIFSMTRVYPPTFYLAAAIGWRVSEARRYTIMHSLLLARLCNLLFAAVAGWLSLLVGKGHRWSIAALLLTPALLALDGSCSQDAVIVSSASLGIAALSRSLVDKSLPSLWEAILAGACLCAVGMTRPPYMLLLLALFLPAVELGRLDRRSIIPPAAVAFLALVMDASWYIAVKPLGYLVGPGAVPAAQIAFLNEHPLRGAGYVLLGSLKKLPVIASSIAEAGSGDVRPSRMIDFFVLLLVVTVFVSQETPPLQKTWSRLLVLLVCVGSSAGMAFAEYIIWTPPAAHYSVEGLQIRHLFVLLPLLGLISGLVRRPLADYAPLCLSSLIVIDLWILIFDAHTFYGLGLFSAFRISQF